MTTGTNALTADQQPYDAIIIGGGPTGATLALALARKSKHVVIVEKTSFPRFHVGESFLPRGYELLGELGLADRLADIPQVPKYGAEFGFGHGRETTCFTFDMSLRGEPDQAFNIERAPFDAMMLDAARDAGAEVLSGTVKRVVRLGEGDVAVDVDGQTLRGRCLLDASGQTCVLGKHLGVRRGMEHHRKVAYFGHFENVARLEGKAEGHPTVAMCDEGWFWIIHIDKRRTSIGMVLDSDIARTIDLPASDMLFWGIARCPLVRERVASAVFPVQTHTIADFSYRCRPYTGPGYFLVGDAAFFLDPIFSSGLCLAMDGAVKVADLVEELLAGQSGTTLPDGRRPRAPSRIRREYRRFVDDSAAPFVRLVDLFYDHPFRELFMEGRGPFQMHKATISVLGGYVFPKPPWSLRWRVFLLHQFARINRYVPLVKRRASYSLRQAQPMRTPSMEAIGACA